MNSILKPIITLIFAALLLTGAAFANAALASDALASDALASDALANAALASDALASDDMKGHDMSSSDKIGTLVHESMVDGFMLSYYLMDLRDQKDHDPKDKAKKDMDKPHHIMLYIMDKDHKPVLEGKVGFMIKKGEATPQKAMAMYMSKGFGITADMKQKGVYSITAKAMLGDTKLMDSFAHEMK